MQPLARTPGLRRLPALLQRTQPSFVLFDSWGGQYSDNPRAIFEELRLRPLRFQPAWVLEPGVGTPSGASTTRPGSRGYLRALGHAGYIVSNSTLPGYFRKKQATTYLQTWHGTPLKRIGFDIPRPQFEGAKRYLRHLAQEVRCWDVLISPNRFSTSIFRSAFHYDGRIIETGYPRNDILSSPARLTARGEVRRRLRLEDDAFVILYAPTWRDNGSFSLELDIDLILRHLSDEYVVLLRAHTLVADTVSIPRHPRTRDVSRYQDIRELYLAADVLVTDYSSAMFDFAVTGKPILLFTYDLEAYRDRVRGFYLDLEAEAPGPILRTTGEVIAALSDLSTVTARHTAAYQRFRERFCHFDDGYAAKRVVDAVFAFAEVRQDS